MDLCLSYMLFFTSFRIFNQQCVTNVMLIGDLYFANVLPNDQLSGRIYKCMVKNVELDNTLGGSYTKVQVLPSKFSYL